MLIDGQHKQPMTPSEFAVELRRIEEKYDGDPEAAHARADDLLCEVLISLGYGEGVGVFGCMRKWCA